MKKSNKQTIGEEQANYLTHGVGLLLSSYGFGMLLHKAWHVADPWYLAGFTIYGICLIAVYISSTLYHWVSRPSLKRKLQIIDHCAIFLMIAGTYTPILLITLKRHGGPYFLVFLWIVALLGIILKFKYTGKYQKLSTASYLAMGWMAIIFLKPLYLLIPSQGLWLLMAGGGLYSLGTIFFHWEKLPYAHSVWHLFVVAGSLCHFLVILEL
ncbi:MULTISPECIES: PAQR family membrane homeostasis protein TrhA [Persicobacter]|uniref:Hemolysin D n=1 Tax=Persicobacter diffluens TaxID=981 RepID=A0AAN4VVH2_9BACT|nr:hemolysin III family protein [Persicobacter sp. CCB-QB2]GJM59565.1 hemolysin D [Persicobacter diffluens]